MTTLEMTLLEVLRIGVEMRAAQARYFKAPQGSDAKATALRQSVTLERKFDAMASRAIRYAETDKMGAR